MKRKIVNIVKYSKLIYCIYYYIASVVMNIIKIFVKPDDKLILFNSFAGRKYDDSPKEIFKMMKKDDRFRDYHFIWAFDDPSQFKVEGAKKIKTDTLSYFVTALKARVWITNSSVERGLNFKGKNTFYFNTWHGTPIKLMGSDIASNNQSFGAKGKSKVDIMTSQGKFETEIFSRTFGIPKECFLECGLPRNDHLANYTEKEQERIKRKLGVPLNKKVILYAPTFREFEKDESKGCVMAPPMNLKKWKKVLGDEYVLLFRAHYEVARIMEIQNDDFVMNMTSYPVLNDLIIISDVLISDYSSIFFDYSITGKPMLHFTYDYKKYSNLRGMYFDIRDHINGGENEDDVINILRNFECQLEEQKSRTFRDKYINFYGSATLQSLNCIAKELEIRM